ncbi:MAG: phosphoesterase, partial [Rubripirellula sp.]
MKDTIKINIDDHQLTLLPMGGVFHGATETLFVTDTHFGKDVTFRKHSIPVPSGSTLTTISKLKSLLQLT